MSQTEKDQKSEAARKGSKRTCCGMARGGGCKMEEQSELKMPKQKSNGEPKK